MVWYHNSQNGGSVVTLVFARVLCRLLWNLIVLTPACMLMCSDYVDGLVSNADHSGDDGGCCEWLMPLVSRIGTKHVEGTLWVEASLSG
jgi:hypothetical protein